MAIGTRIGNLHSVENDRQAEINAINFYEKGAAKARFKNIMWLIRRSEEKKESINIISDWLTVSNCFDKKITVGQASLKIQALFKARRHNSKQLEDILTKINV